MRYKICEIPQRNTSNKIMWLEQQVCRTCSVLSDYFSWNGNYLHEYCGVRN